MTLDLSYLNPEDRAQFNREVERYIEDRLAEHGITPKGGAQQSQPATAETSSDSSGDPEPSDADRVAAIANAQSPEEVLAAVPAEMVVGHQPERQLRELSAEEAAEYHQKLSQAASAEEVLAIYTEATGHDPRIQD